MGELAKSPFRPSDTLIIGLGGHKCASTWLYHYFSAHPQCFTSYVKELNYFRNPYTLNAAWLMKHNAQKVQDLANKFQKENADFDFLADHAEDVLAYAKMSERVSDYAANMRSVGAGGNYWENFSRRQDYHSHMVDISPSYCLCDQETLVKMRDAHVNTRFFYMMRDPAERAFSAFKFRYKRRKKRLGARPRVRLKQLQDFLSEFPVADAQCDYPTNLNQIQNVIPKAHIYIGFYEKLFNDDAIKKLCKVLGLEFEPAQYDQYVHKTDPEDQSINMNKIERAFLVERYNDVYKDIHERFLEEAPDNWNWPSEIAKIRKQA